jgi:hypothetical protein
LFLHAELQEDAPVMVGLLELGADQPPSGCAMGGGK